MNIILVKTKALPHIVPVMSNILLVDQIYKNRLHKLEKEAELGWWLVDQREVKDVSMHSSSTKLPVRWSTSAAGFIIHSL